jgi:photosystem II stability/assembly factor-like uncharacterized protein
MMASPLPQELQEIIYGLAVASVDGASGAYFAAHTRGLRRSNDGGRTWRTVFESLDPDQPIAVTSVIPSPGFQRDGRVLAGVHGAIITSCDGGERWSSSILPLPSPFISTLALSPGFEQDGIAFAGTMEDGVFISSDHGQSWVAWNLGLLDHSVLSLVVSPAFVCDQTLFAGTESGMFLSRNGGRFWHEIAFPIDDAPVLSLALSPSFANDGLLFAGTAARGLFCSHHPWEHWEKLAHFPPDSAINSVLVAPGFSEQPDLLILLDDRLLVSRDAGQSWMRCCANLGGADLTVVAAPWGLDLGCPLIAGRIDGRVERYTIDQ